MKILLEIVVVGIVGSTILFVYQEYRNDIWGVFVTEEKNYTAYVGSTALSVSVADSPAEFELGLSGVTSLGDIEGKLFIFPDEQRHGIWMKDMNFSIDVLWFNNDLELVHIEEAVSPSSYPAIFVPREKARFVIETNAYLASSLQMGLGDKLLLPSSLLPSDIQLNLLE
jgi:hypothetical protein